MAEPYAFVCCLCDHGCSQHMLDPDAPTIHGPYVCSVCGCQMSQSTRVRGVTRDEYERLTHDVG